MTLIEDKGWLAVGSSQGWLYIVDISDKSLIHQSRHGQLPIYSLQYNKQADSLWILHAKGGLEIISLQEFGKLLYRQLSSEHLRTLVFDHERNQCYLGSSDNQIYVLSSDGNQTLHQWQAHANSVFNLCLHPSGKQLLSGGRDAHLKSWALDAQFHELQSIPAHNFTINEISFSADHQYLATGSRDKTVKIWDAENLQLLKVIDPIRNDGHRHSVNKVVWHPDGSLLSAGDDKRIIQWRIEK